MSIRLEAGKLKRTGFLPAFLVGGVLAAAIPAANMLFRSESYTALLGNPLEILMNANWQMMAMMNLFLVVIGSCMLYHTEFADNGIQRMEMLPVGPSSLFFSKLFILLAALGIVLALEAVSLVFCSFCWFQPGNEIWPALAEIMAFEAALLIPASILMVGISSACRNMWISLGIGVTGMFTAIIFTNSSFFLTILPFTLPFQILQRLGEGKWGWYMIAVGAEAILFAVCECSYLKIRREVV